MSALLSKITDALASGNAKAFLRMLRVGEGTADDHGYMRLFGGENFTSGYGDHPRKAVTKSLGSRMITSTAAGAYQFLARTWDECAKALGLVNFSPYSQDCAALYLIWRRGALADVIEGRIERAIEKCNREWASLPGSPYGQPVKRLADCLRLYQQYGGEFAAPPAPAADSAPADDQDQSTQETPAMPLPLAPFISAALPFIVEAIPKLGRIFGSGSKVAERNIKAAEAVVEIVKEATGARNAQEAVEAIKNDPSAAAAASKAIDARWFELSEVGGGVKEARAADAAAMGGRSFLFSPSFWIALCLLPLVYLIVLSLIGVIGSATWSDEVRAALAGTISGSIVGGLVGYYYGQTTSRNRTNVASE